MEEEETEYVQVEGRVERGGSPDRFQLDTKNFVPVCPVMG